MSVVHFEEFHLDEGATLNAFGIEIGAEIAFEAVGVHLNIYSMFSAF